MQIEVIVSSSIRFAEADQGMPELQGFIDLPEVPARGDMVNVPGYPRYRVISRHWYPGTNKPPTIVLGHPGDPH